MFAAGVVMAGTAPAQDGSASFDRTMQAYSNEGMVLDVKAEPTLTLGAHTQVTGLLMDCSAPRQTWAMLDPFVPSQNPPAPVPPSMLPVTVPCSGDDPAAVHGANFMLLRFSFP